MYILIACMRNYQVKDIITFSEDLGPMQYTIGYSEEVIPALLDNDSFKNYLGQIQTNDLKNNPIAAVVSNNENVEQSKIFAVLNNILTDLEVFSSAMWFIKDNAVNPSFAVMYGTENNLFFNNRRNIYFSKATGNYKRVAYSKEEYEEVFEIYKILQKLLQKEKIGDYEFSEGYQNMSTLVDSSLPSFSRALLLLRSARNSDFIPAKISSYISVLECLMAVEGNNTHKTAERVAHFVGQNDGERIEIFEDVKDIYGIRSSYVHGSEMRNKYINKIESYSIKADELTRKVFKKLIKYFPSFNYNEKKDKKGERKQKTEVNKWFDELIFKRAVILTYDDGN